MIKSLSTAPSWFVQLGVAQTSGLYNLNNNKTVVNFIHGVSFISSELLGFKGTQTIRAS